MACEVDVISEAYPVDILRGTTVPIMVPAHNSEKRIKYVLANLARQPLPFGAKLEVVVCANDCRDNTAPEAKVGLEALERVRPGSVTTLIETPVPGQAQALNTMMGYLGPRPYVVEVQDDVFVKMGGLQLIAAAALARPELGVIGMLSKPIPEYKGRNGTMAARVAADLWRGIGLNESSIVDRCAAFNPQIVGQFPDIVSVDCYMMHQALLKSEGFGVLAASLTGVYHRVPNTWREVLAQRDMYVKGARQIDRDFPDLNKSLRVSNARRMGKLEKIRNLFSSEGEEKDMRVKFLELVVLVYGKFVSKNVMDKFNPYTSSKRERIWSSV